MEVYYPRGSPTAKSEPLPCLAAGAAGLSLAAIGIDGDSHPGRLDRMREKVPPHRLVDERPTGILARRISRRHRTVRTLRVAFHVDVRNQPASVAVGRRVLVDVHDGAVVVQAEHLPRPAVVIAGPTAIIRFAAVSEIAISIGRSCGVPNSNTKFCEATV